MAKITVTNSSQFNGIKQTLEGSTDKLSLISIDVVSKETGSYFHSTTVPSYNKKINNLLMKRIVSRVLVGLAFTFQINWLEIFENIKMHELTLSFWFGKYVFGKLDCLLIFNKLVKISSQRVDINLYTNKVSKAFISQFSEEVVKIDRRINLDNLTLAIANISHIESCRLNTTSFIQSLDQFNHVEVTFNSHRLTYSRSFQNRLSFSMMKKLTISVEAKDIYLATQLIRRAYWKELKISIVRIKNMKEILHLFCMKVSHDNKLYIRLAKTIVTREELKIILKYNQRFFYLKKKNNEDIYIPITAEEKFFLQTYKLFVTIGSCYKLRKA